MNTRRNPKIASQVAINALIVALGCGAGVAWPVDFQRQVTFEIAAQPLSAALADFSRQAKIQVMSQDRALGERSTAAISGMYSVGDALAKLLQGTQLAYRSAGENTVAIVQERQEARPNAELEGVEKGVRMSQENDAGGAGKEQSEEKGGARLEEVVVTAQKKEERRQDVPVPVTVLNTSNLSNTNQLRVEDYYASVPGLSLVQDRNGQKSQILIRGLSSGSSLANPGVGVVIDDIPFGSALLWGGGTAVPDVDPGDLSRIEVLRGPQGTLYGASSIGGLLKYVTVDPSTNQSSGRVQFGANTVKGGDDIGYNVRGSVNVPLSDTFAVRASAFDYLNPGYIDNVTTGKKDVNELKVKGGRLSALWRASDVITLKLSALAQRAEPQGAPDQFRSLGDLKQQVDATAGQYKVDIQAYSATLTADLGWGKLTSLSGYSRFKNNGTNDIGSPALLYKNDIHTNKASQELRLDTPLGERIDWQVGAFYNKEQFGYVERLLFIEDPATGVLTGGGLLDPLISDGDHHELAAFTTFTFKLKDRFDVQVGGREAYYKGDFQQVWANQSLNPALPSTYLPPHVSYKDNAFTYLVTPRFRLSPDWMAYARFASGYRTGGPNSSLGNTVLPTMKPDTSENYELGVKGSFFDQKASVDLSIYYIDWKDLQLFSVYTLPSGVNASIYVNATSAKSQGLEASFDLTPWQGFKTSLWAAWNTAELTEDMPPTILTDGLSGDRLPDSPKFSGHFSVEQAFKLTGSLDAFAGGSVSYIGDRLTAFVRTGSGLVRQVRPSYTKTDLKAGVRSGSWSAALYVNNLFDRRGVLGKTSALPGQESVLMLITPRSIGVNLTKEFDATRQ